MKYKFYLFILFSFFINNIFCNEKKVDYELLKTNRIHIFIHVCTINHWKDVLKEQLFRIKKSGLYKACDSISLCVLGLEDVKLFVKYYPKIKILLQSSDTSQYERATLYKLHSFCKFSPNNVLVLYLHTKGVSKVPPNDNVTDWRRFMEYFAIDKWKDCVMALQEHDACGVNWWLSWPANVNFFAGNFWWARSDYIKTLPDHIGERYIDPEIWIGLNTPNVKCFHDSNNNPYQDRYPESNYIK